jgi:hypothetical protein
VSKLEEEISAAINRACAENASNTPDFILADYLCDCLRAFNLATNRRENWHGRPVIPGYISGLDLRAKGGAEDE